MKLDVTCALVRDLLPLYADGVLSEDSGAVVDAHLPECPPCASELERLRAPVPVKKKSARQSLKTTRRKLILSIVSAVLAIAVLLVSTSFIGSKIEPVPYFDGLFEPIFVFRGAPGDPMGEGDFYRIQVARQPMFEYGACGETSSEDVIVERGPRGERVRVGVLYIQVRKSSRDIWISNFRARFHNGRNPIITGYGYSAYKVSPMSEAEKESFRQWEESMGVDRSGIDESDFANWTRDVQISRVYYYDGPIQNMSQDSKEGWSQRNGVYEDSVLLYDEVVDSAEEAGERWRLYWQTDPEGTTGPHTFVQSDE